MDRLFIIGNGFDIHNGIYSTYEDFREWLIRNNHYDVVLEMEKMIKTKEGKCLLWNSLEKALSQVDINNLINTNSKYLLIQYD